MSWLLPRQRSLLGASILLLACLALPGLVQAQSPLLELESIMVYPGQNAAPIGLFLSHIAPVEGVEIGLATSSPTVQMTDLLLLGGVLQGLSLEFSAVSIDADGQEASIRWILDSSAPFDVVIPIGEDQLLATLLIDVTDDFEPSSTVRIEFVDGAGTPPATNTVHSASMALTPEVVSAQVTGLDTNQLSIQTDVVRAGEFNHPVDLVLFNTSNVQGFSAVVQFDQNVLTCTGVSIAGTITEVTGAEFVEEIIDNDRGYTIVGVLLDVVPPYEAQMIPASGFALPVSRLFFDVEPSIPFDIVTPLRYIDNLGTPPIENLLVIQNESILPEKQDGFLQIVGEPIFVRGDTNGSLDLRLDDVIQSFFYVMNRCPECPPILCLVALDANDDGRVDLADGIWVASYLYLSGPPPLPPFPNPGPDPTPDGLSCDGSPL